MGLDGLQLVQAPVQLLQGLDREADVQVVGVVAHLGVGHRRAAGPVSKQQE